MTGKRNQASATPVGSPSSENMSDNMSKEQDRFLPIANVSRLMKKALPANAKISKEAKETVQGCVSEFISFITGEASDKCQREKRKTINGDDLLWAMTTLGFENYVGPLKVYLNKCRETEGDNNLIAGQDDSSPTHTDHAVNSDKVTATYLPPVNSDFHSSNHVGFYSFGSQMTPEVQRGPTGYKEDLATNAFSLSRVFREGDAHGNRALAAELHFGVEW